MSEISASPWLDKSLHWWSRRDVAKAIATAISAHERNKDRATAPSEEQASINSGHATRVSRTSSEEGRRNRPLLVACYLGLRERRMDLLQGEYSAIAALPAHVVRECALAVLLAGRGDVSATPPLLAAANMDLLEGPAAPLEADFSLFTGLEDGGQQRTVIETLTEIGLAAVAGSSWATALYCADRVEQLLTAVAGSSLLPFLPTCWVNRATFDAAGILAVSEFHTSDSTVRQTALRDALAPVEIRHLLTADHAIAVVCTGNLAHLQGRYADAATALSRGVKLSGTRPGLALHAQIELAFVRIRQGRWQDANDLVTDLAPLVEATDRDWLAPQAAAIASLVAALRGEVDHGQTGSDRLRGSHPSITSQLTAIVTLHLNVATCIARHDWSALQRVLEDASIADYRTPYRAGEFAALNLLACWHLKQVIGFRRRLGDWGRVPGAHDDPYYWAFVAIDQESRQKFTEAVESAHVANSHILPDQDPLGRVWVRMVTGTVIARYGDAGAPSPIDALAVFEEANVELINLGATRYLDLCEAIVGRVIEEIRRAGVTNPMSLLTAQQQRIARVIADGYTSEEVAAIVGLSRKTIDFHVGNILRRLDISSRREIGRALRLAWSDRSS